MLEIRLGNARSAALALEKLQSEGIRWLHLGLTPWVDLQPEHEIDGYNRFARFTMDQLGRHAAAIYPALTQLDFKLKWAPQAIEPEYIGFAPRVNLGGLWALLRSTRAI